MVFLSDSRMIKPEKPLFIGILANTMLSTVPGLSGAGPNPMGSLLVPVLDAELIWQGSITSSDATPNTPTGCPTPASITRAVLDHIGVPPLFINAGLVHRPTVPVLDLHGQAGGDPRDGPAVPDAMRLYNEGIRTGKLLSAYDMLVVGECVPGGTTTALCVLRSFGYDAKVSSASVTSPDILKEEVYSAVVRRIGHSLSDPLEIVRETGDPMIAVAAGLAEGFPGTLILAGGTQMLAVAAVIKSIGRPLPEIVTTVYVRDDCSASCDKTAQDIGVPITYVDPDFGKAGHSGLDRYCIGEIKEGMGYGGAMMLGTLLGYSPEEITRSIISFVSGYSP
ncbi:nicotinate mononucleotide-dependent phosphoribosyltransferase CobT [Methanospirillum sp.]|uniref:nicotinate mononucleotide-dependent phosphoribosyltransferase CobT n=1 Tax=Methanospirillum sp. TaxID=45200 RepID=UPI002983C04D|nr:TIGR00303 family protein [Methanospirillum sp.]